MNIVVGADHGGYILKDLIAKWLKEQGHNVVDVGCNSAESVDYPDYALKAVDEIIKGSSEFGILVCGTGIGMSIAVIFGELWSNRHCFFCNTRCCIYRYRSRRWNHRRIDTRFEACNIL